MENRKLAGFFLLLIAIYEFSIWTMFLVVSNLSYITWEDNLNALLAPENDIKPYFVASLVSMTLSFICSIIYYSKLSNSQTTLLTLLIACSVQAISAIWFLGWFLKVLYTLPVIYAYLAFKNFNKLADT